MVGILGVSSGELGVLIGVLGVLVGVIVVFVGAFLYHSLWKSASLKKSTAPPVVAVVTNMSYDPR